jgi:hypothetical protein
MILVFSVPADRYENYGEAAFLRADYFEAKSQAEVARIIGCVPSNVTNNHAMGRDTFKCKGQYIRLQFPEPARRESVVAGVVREDGHRYGGSMLRAPLLVGNIVHGIGVVRRLWWR